MKHISNEDIAHILREMAALYEMKGVPFKPRAYEKAALSIDGLDEEVGDIFRKGGKDALVKIAGIGAGIGGHIDELLRTGRFREYDSLKKKMPVKIEELTDVEGVGPQTVKVLWKKLGVRNLGDLERAARGGKIGALAGFGKKSEERILDAIAFVKQSGGRRILGFILPEIKRLEEAIARFPETERAAVAGSARRRKEAVGDIDILAVSKKPGSVMKRFIGLPNVAHVYGTGKTKTNIRLKNGLDADLRVVPERSWGAALNYFTGSKAHNVALRERAIKKGWKLNEYGLFKGRRFIAGKTEGELYKKLGLAYIEPELREMTGEIEAAQKGSLPKLVGYGDLCGDLQVQTDWTDGKDSIETMANAAKDAGLSYVAVTDHTKSLAMTRGADEEKLLRQIKEIGKMNARLKRGGSSFRILTGAEVNIMKDGTLDIDDAVLSKLEVVGAAIHAHFNLSKHEQTARVIRAMENPNVDIIFHLTTRLINKRKPIELDIEAIIKSAKRTGTVLEIDAYPDRLDIKDDYIRRCVAAGVKMSIDSDAHASGHFMLLEHGIAQARRGWAEKKDIINAWPAEKMLSMLKGGRRE